MKISMLMENTPFADGFQFEHGLSIHSTDVLSLVKDRALGR